MSVDLIMPATCHNEKLFKIVLLALQSCKISCDARVLYLANNDKGTEWGQKIKNEVLRMNYEYLYIDEPFNLSRFLNFGFQLTQGEFIAYSNADVLFFPGWLENILKLWKKHPKYYSMHPFTYSPTHRGLNYRNDDCELIPTVVPCDHPGAAGVMVMKRKDAHKWDERFTYWEHDADYWKWMRENSKIAGICMNSRVDHKIRGIIENCEPGVLPANMCEEGTKIYKEKWKL